jgi:hypothetical protein
MCQVTGGAPSPAVHPSALIYERRKLINEDVEGLALPRPEEVITAPRRHSFVTGMAVHKPVLQPDEYSYVFGGREPMVGIRPGNIVEVSTEDCFGGRVTSPGQLSSGLVQGASGGNAVHARRNLVIPDAPSRYGHLRLTIILGSVAIAV